MGDSGRATAKDRWGPSDARRDARKTKAFAKNNLSGPIEREDRRSQDTCLHPYDLPTWSAHICHNQTHRLA